jgi:hypothetical protein
MISRREAELVRFAGRKGCQADAVRCFCTQLDEDGDRSFYESLVQSAVERIAGNLDEALPLA